MVLRNLLKNIYYFFSNKISDRLKPVQRISNPKYWIRLIWQESGILLIWNIFSASTNFLISAICFFISSNLIFNIKKVFINEYFSFSKQADGFEVISIIHTSDIQNFLDISPRFIISMFCFIKLFIKSLISDWYITVFCFVIILSINFR